jgi:O-methyltransferase
MLQRAYLDLLKNSLLGELAWENEVRIHYLRECLAGRDRYSPDALLHIARARHEMAEGHRARSRIGRLLDDRLEILPFTHTMIGRARLDNLEACLDKVCAAGVPGDLIECGVWRGGAAVFMRGYLEAYGLRGRTVWVADSFAGCPPPSLPQDQGEDLSAAAFPALAVPEDAVRELFARYGLLDGQVRFLAGWFRDTLAQAPIERLALLRIDADLYESTRDALEALYPRLAPGGFAIVDDYGAVPACRQAVEDYRGRAGIAAPLEAIDWTGVFWQKDATER